MKVNEIGTICECGLLTEIVPHSIGHPIQCYEYFSENLNTQITGPAQKRKVMRALNMEETS